MKKLYLVAVLFLFGSMLTHGMAGIPPGSGHNDVKKTELFVIEHDYATVLIVDENTNQVFDSLTNQFSVITKVNVVPFTPFTMVDAHKQFKEPSSYCTNKHYTKILKQFPKKTNWTKTFCRYGSLPKLE